MGDGLAPASLRMALKRTSDRLGIQPTETCHKLDVPSPILQFSYLHPIRL